MSGFWGYAGTLLCHPISMNSGVLERGSLWITKDATTTWEILRCWGAVGQEPETRTKCIFLLPLSPCTCPPMYFLLHHTLNQNPWGWGPAVPVLTISLDDWEAHWSLCTTALWFFFFFFASSGAYYCKFATSQRAAGKSGSIRKPFQREEITEEIKHWRPLPWLQNQLMHFIFRSH